MINFPYYKKTATNTIIIDIEIILVLDNLVTRPLSLWERREKDPGVVRSHDHQTPKSRNPVRG